MSPAKKIVYASPSSERIEGGYRLIIPGELPPGMNRMNKMHWSDVHRTKRDWRFLLLKAFGCKRPSFKRARIAMTLYQLGRMDRDNLESTFKVIGDALQAAEIIPGDDQLTIERPPVQSVHVSSRSMIKTVIEITELRGEES